MLLACCFRQPKSKKAPKIKKHGEKEDTNLLSKNLIYSPIVVTSNTNSQLQGSKTKVNRHASKFKKETLVSSKIEKSTPKRAPPSFVPNNRFSASTPKSKVSQTETRSPTFINVSTIKPKEESLPKLTNAPKDVNKMFASTEDLGGTTLAYSASQQTPMRSIQSLSSSSSTPKNEIIAKSSETIFENSDASLSSLTPKRHSIIKTGSAVNTDNISSDELHLHKISKEKQTLKNEEKDNIICEIKQEYEKKIGKLITQNKIDLENEKELFRIQLLTEKENLRKDLETAKTKAKNSANETISQLNKQIVLERAKMFAEQQENSKHLEDDYRMKEDRLNQSLALFEESLKLLEEREQAWEDERSEVLTEVQRLKAEATKMVKILAMEYEEDNVSEDKRRSLSQEVYSLQLVIDMRTGEVRNLREQLNIATQQQEEAEVNKDKLKKATARVEDLQEQIKMKNKVEKQLSVEKIQLELNLTDTNKVADRMSRNVEALQWRIRNSFDLPVDNLTSVTSDHERASLPACVVTQYHEKSYSEIMQSQSKPRSDNMLQANQEICSFAMLKDKIIETTITNPKLIDYLDDQDVTSDLSPCSDGFNASFADHVETMGKSEQTVNNIESSAGDVSHEVIDCDEDVIDEIVDSDEGVSDISSYSEHPNSPSFNENKEIQNCQVNSSETMVVKMCASDQKKEDLSIYLHSNVKSLKSPTTSPVKERIPSRFSFGN